MLITLVMVIIIIIVCLLSQCVMYYVWHEIQRLQCWLVILVVIISWPCSCLGVQKSSNEPICIYFILRTIIFLPKKKFIKGIFCNLLLKIFIVSLVYHIFLLIILNKYEFLRMCKCCQPKKKLIWKWSKFQIIPKYVNYFKVYLLSL